jgi:cytochrome c551/c552
MKRFTWPLGGLLLAVLVGLTVAQTSKKATGSLELPAENVSLRPSKLPGYEIASRQCAICHSADYIAYQPPGMNLPQWTAEVTKMHSTYGAPIAGEDIRLVGIYLTSVYGASASIPAADLALPAPAPPAVVGQGDDAQALLNRNGCLACHASLQKVVGPAYHDVAEKYRADPQALAKLQTSIREGGVGRWGNVPMPPFAALSEPQLKALAEYVLKQ